MLLILAQGLLGLALLYFGGDALVRGACELAARLGVSPLAIGLTVVACGTSAPELAVSLDAVSRGADNLALGNVVGSNIANLALILGLSVLLVSVAVEAKILRIDAPLLIIVSLVLVFMLRDGTISRFEGGLLVASLLAFVAFTFWEAQREEDRVQEELAAAVPKTPPNVGLSIVVLVFGVAMLALGGQQLVSAALDLARAFSVPQVVIGLTIVAVGTSLPELAASLVAIARGQHEIAVGNVIGSNLFNILAILGITALVSPLKAGQITSVDLGLMVALAVLLAVLLLVRLRLGRPEGILLLGVYMAYNGWLFLH